MFCSNCGTELFPSAEFCHKCGQKVGEKSIPIQTPVTYLTEVCTVDAFITKVHLLRRHTWAWFANAIGPNGEYTVATSKEFLARGDRYPYPWFGDDKPEKAARAELVAQLLRDGWDPTDNNYYRQHFQRLIPKK